MLEELLLTPWSLFEVPLSLEFPEPERRLIQGDDQVDIQIVRDPWRLSPEFRPSILQANFLNQMKVPHDTTLDNLLDALYTYLSNAATMVGDRVSADDRAQLQSLGYARDFAYPFITHIGYPISFDPLREVLLTGYPLAAKAVPRPEVVDAFLKLDFSYSYTANHSDRADVKEH